MAVVDTSVKHRRTFLVRIIWLACILCLSSSVLTLLTVKAARQVAAAADDDDESHIRLKNNEFSPRQTLYSSVFFDEPITFVFECLSHQDIIVTINKDEYGNFPVYISPYKLPTKNEYNCRDGKAEEGVTTSSIRCARVTTSGSQPMKWYIAVHSYNLKPYSFEIKAQAVTSRVAQSAIITVLSLVASVLFCTGWCLMGNGVLFCAYIGRKKQWHRPPKHYSDAQPVTNEVVGSGSGSSYSWPMQESTHARTTLTQHGPTYSSSSLDTQPMVMEESTPQRSHRPVITHHSLRSSNRQPQQQPQPQEQPEQQANYIPTVWADE